MVEVLERGGASKPEKTEIVMRVVYHDPVTPFFGTRLVKKLGARKAIELLFPVVEVDRDPATLAPEAFPPNTLLWFGPSKGEPGVGSTYEGAASRAKETRGKWLWAFRASHDESGAFGMADTLEKVFEGALPAIATRDW